MVISTPLPAAPVSSGAAAVAEVPPADSKGGVKRSRDERDGEDDEEVDGEDAPVSGDVH